MLRNLIARHVSYTDILQALKIGKVFKTSGLLQKLNNIPMETSKYGFRFPGPMFLYNMILSSKTVYWKIEGAKNG